MKPALTLTLVLAVVLALMGALPVVAEACPSCKAGVATDKSSGPNPVDGYFYSIIFMASLPFVLMGFMGFIIWRAQRAGAPIDGIASS